MNAAEGAYIHGSGCGIVLDHGVGFVLDRCKKGADNVL